DNHLRHRPLGRMAICVHSQDSLFETVARVAAARIAGCTVILSVPTELNNPVTDFIIGREGRLLTQQAQVARQNDAEVASMMAEVDRARYAAPERVPSIVYQAAAEAGIHIARAPVLMDGRLELLHYYLNQTISHAYHRAGNQGERGLGRLEL
ncbi:MAG: aldehyde dehydrogenase, partial [Desulfobacteraceae bacterium]|nr:aldehyde dehydrogenase [Desulfobacteraceae bacterium]